MTLRGRRETGDGGRETGSTERNTRSVAPCQGKLTTAYRLPPTVSLNRPGNSAIDANSQ